MKTIVAVLVSTFLMVGAYAQSPSPSAGAPASTSAMEKADAKENMKVEKHIKELHAKLKITSAQEAQWAEVVQTMRNNAIELDKAIDKREEMVGKATAIDNLNAYADVAQAHADGVKRLSAVFANLYSAMPDDQKKVADAVFAHHEHHEHEDGKSAKAKK